LADAWVAEGREEEARALLEAALGELSVWRRDEVPEPPRPGADQAHPPSADAEPDAARPVADLEAAVEESADADLPFAAVDLAPPRLVRLVATRAACSLVDVAIFAIPPHPRERAAKVPARVCAFERHKMAAVR
jgi:hypothetical protein